MNRQSQRSFLTIFIALGIILSVPIATNSHLQKVFISTLSPVWEGILQTKYFFQTLFGTPFTYTRHGRALTLEEELDYLRLQNALLAREVSDVHALHEHELFIKEKTEQLANEGLLKTKDLPALKTHLQNLRHIFELELEAIPARVVYRSPASWNSILWINVGEEMNAKLGKKIVAKNSPVVKGTSIIGIIEEVSQKQSKVRLLTDRSFSPSVRAQREVNGEKVYLAKGELQGCCKTLWRSKSQVLKGTGFNYDFSDAVGPARDLRSGKPVGSSQEPALPIIKKEDLLVTTGMDGIFPPGLEVARVSLIAPLREGDYYYDIEAVPTAGDLEQLSLVFVLPAR